MTLNGQTVPVGAQARTPQSFRDAIRQTPNIERPAPGTPGALRLSAAEVRAIAAAQERGLNFVPGEVVVKFRAGTSDSDRQRALGALRSRPSVDDLEWQGAVAIVRDALQPNALILAEQLMEQPEVEFAEPNYLYRTGPRPLAQLGPVAGGARPAATPNDPSFGSRQWNFQVLGLPAAWDINPGASQDVTVAVVDSGMTSSSGALNLPIWTGEGFEVAPMPYGINPDLDPGRIVAPFDFVLFTAGAPVIDMVGHGTHVSSTVAESTNNNLALAGVAYNARIMPVKVCFGYWDGMIVFGDAGEPGFLPLDFGGCPNSAIAAGIRYAADNGADVINLSLGGPSPAATIRDAIVYAVSRGAVVTIAMGNEFEVGNATSYPAAYAAEIDGVLSVASVGRSLTRAFYSNTGAHAEIAAPGGNSRDGGSDGLIYQASLGAPSSPLQLFPRFDLYFEIGIQGTSMASPHVAGVAALVRDQMPTLSPANLEKILRMTARPCSASSCTTGAGTLGSKTNEFGYGLIQPRAALFGLGIAR